MKFQENIVTHQDNPSLLTASLALFSTDLALIILALLSR